MRLSTFIILIVLVSAMSLVRCEYNGTKRIFDELLGSKFYHADVRPVLDQSKPITVFVNFEILSIVEVNDVTQSFTCNGIVQLNWLDERATWDPSNYGGVRNIHPAPKLIWRPRLVLVNTLGKRDLFEDDYSPTSLHHTGFATWYPGSIFPIACDLNLKKYPFDEQKCSIRMLPMALLTHALLFRVEAVYADDYTVNGVWDLKGHQIVNGTTKVDGGYIAYFEVTFHLKRRPTFFLLNILLPVVLLSFLNLMVFVIPVASGEKISYGITVLLALTVFISIVSSMLPKSSDSIPHVIIYLFALLVVSSLTVIDSIVIVFLCHMEEKTERSNKARRSFRKAIGTIAGMGRSVSPENGSNTRNTPVNDPLGPDNNNPMFQTRRDNGHLFQAGRTSWTDMIKGMRDDDDGDERKKSINDDGGDNVEDFDDNVNKYKIIGRYIDFVSFIVFIVIWVILTLWIFIEITS